MDLNGRMNEVSRFQTAAGFRHHGYEFNDMATTTGIIMMDGVFISHRSEQHLRSR